MFRKVAVTSWLEEQNKGRQIGWERCSSLANSSSAVGRLTGSAGNRESHRSLQIIKDLEGISGAGLSQAHLIAKIYATLNEKEMALSWLERGLATGAIGVFYKDDPVWDAIRSDPRFTDLVRRTGIPL